MFLLHCPKKIGTVQHFRPSRCRKRCTVPMFLGPGMQKHCTVPIFDLETLKRLVEFFGTVLGQYSVFAPLSLKDWDSTALQALQVSRTLYCPNVFGSRHAKTLHCPNVFWVQACKKAVLSQKTQKTQSFQGLQVTDWDSTVFLPLCLKKIGTVQHFRPSRCRKRCAVPIFWVQSCKTLYCPNL